VELSGQSDKSMWVLLRLLVSGTVAVSVTNYALIPMVLWRRCSQDIERDYVLRIHLHENLRGAFLAV